MSRDRIEADAPGGRGRAAEWGVWLGVIAGALGLLLSAAVLVRGGGYLVVVPRLAYVLPLAVVGTVTALASGGVGRREGVGPVPWTGVVVAFGVVWNFLVYWLHFGGGTWGLLVPLAKPTGFDFLNGLYRPAHEFSTATSGWPPLTLILGKPFTLLPLATAHVVQLVILTALAVVCVVLSAVLAVRALPATGGDAAPRAGATALALVFGLWLLTSSGFMYEIERANIDFYVLFFALLLAVWLTLRLPALALVVGAHAGSRDRPQVLSGRVARALLLALSLAGGRAGRCG